MTHSDGPCTFLGTPGDRETHYLQPHRSHRCHAVAPAARIAAADQIRLCFGDSTECWRLARVGRDGGRVAPSSTPGSDHAEPAGFSEVGAYELDRPADEIAYGVGDRRSSASEETDLAAIASAVADRAAALSPEAWLAAIVTGAIAVAVLYGLFVRPRMQPSVAPNPTIAALAVALRATATWTATTAPTTIRVPSSTAASEPPATVAAPTAVPGGRMVALSPSERGVGAFNGHDRLPVFGARELNVGVFGKQQYIAGMLVPLNRLPKGSEIHYVALEIAGFSDANLASDGVWTVQMLDAQAASDWANHTFESLLSASPEPGVPAWILTRRDLAARRVNVLEFGDGARQAVVSRLQQGKVAFRITGPGGSNDNLFAWDTGYGEGYGTRPVLRVGYVPPAPTAGPRPGAPTELPLVLWTAEPTPAPTKTPLPAKIPAELAGKLLFLSDRFGSQPRLMVYDPDRDRVGQVTQPWIYDAARARELSADGQSVGVFEIPCGTGATAVVGVEKNIIEPADPARRCAQIVLKDPAGGQLEVTAPGFVHYDPVISPDGLWIAYVSQITGSDEIFKIRRDGTGNTRLTDNAWEWDKHPSWSPDGRRIAFWSNREGRRQVYVMDADGRDVRNVTRSQYNDFDPVWVR